jgi:protein-tyrosine phosphatase
MRVLFVCTGNVCRSPMGEALLRHALEERGCNQVEVASAGTWADLGHPATVDARVAVSAYGASLNIHHSRPLTPEELNAADLIVAMTSVHLREIRSLAPEAANKVVLMKELVEIERASDGSGLDTLFDGVRPSYRRALDVDDPIGLPFSAYERCAKELKAGVDVLADVLCG